ncbi:MAG: hypothetical protein WC707_04950 [Candidatus Babeliaceae bacterium]|jgi:hypothetical protein
MNNNKILFVALSVMRIFAMEDSEPWVGDDKLPKDSLLTEECYHQMNFGDNCKAVRHMLRLIKKGTRIKPFAVISPNKWQGSGALSSIEDSFHITDVSLGSSRATPERVIHEISNVIKIGRGEQSTPYEEKQQESNHWKNVPDTFLENPMMSKQVCSKESNEPCRRLTGKLYCACDNSLQELLQKIKSGKAIMTKEDPEKVAAAIYCASLNNPHFTKNEILHLYFNHVSEDKFYLGSQETRFFDEIISHLKKSNQNK